MWLTESVRKKFVLEAVDLGQYCKVMKKTFEKMEQSQHYQTMTHEKD